jgi:hypothetical protein
MDQRHVEKPGVRRDQEVAATCDLVRVAGSSQQAGSGRGIRPSGEGLSLRLDEGDVVFQRPSRNRLLDWKQADFPGFFSSSMLGF